MYVNLKNKKMNMYRNKLHVHTEYEKQGGRLPLLLFVF